MGAVFAPTRFPSVGISVRDLVADRNPAYVELAQETGRGALLSALSLAPHFVGKIEWGVFGRGVFK